MSDTELLEKLAHLGKTMRELQSAYFKARTQNLLHQCKTAEREFDALIVSYFARRNETDPAQPKLFGD